MPRKLIRLAVAVGALAIAVTALAQLDPGDTRRASANARHRSAASSRPYLAQLTISHRALRRVPRSYFGLSTEYWALPLLERRRVLLERVLALLHAQGDGPLILRIGGDSADRTLWKPRLRPIPPWIFQLTPTWLRATSLLVRSTGIRVIDDVNLVTDSPAQAGVWARAVERALPRRSIVGFEIGNEPDLYKRSYWRAAIVRPLVQIGLLPRSISAHGYVHDFARYARTVARVAPGVPILGPALARPRADRSWIARLLAAPHPGLRTISAHSYAFSGCARPGAYRFPTIPRLLAERATAGIARAIAPAVVLAHRAGLRFRLTELNSVDCGGRRGVSDTFATALWAPDVLFELLRVGVDGANLHVRAATINAPFALSPGGLTARPLLYGLILFLRTLGPRATLLRSHLTVPAGTDLKAWAVRVAGHGLHLLLINKGSRPAHLRLLGPATGTIRIERLLAPSPDARTQVTLGGQRLGPDARWQGALRYESLHPRAHAYTLTVPGTSAALVLGRL